MQSENTAGAEPQITEIENTEAGINNLAELLEDEATDAGASQGTDSGSDESKPTKFNDLAGRLGVELDDLYKLEVSQAEDGSPITVEYLKDFHAKQADFELREIEFEERRTEQEAEMMQAQEELREVLAALPKNAVKPEVLQKIRDKHDAEVKVERQRALQVIPEWRDEKKRTQDIEGMVEHLQQYGYPVNYLERVVDHRMVKYIRDNWQREQRIRQALAKVKAGKPNPTKPSIPTGSKPSKRPLAGVKRGNARSKLEAVFSDLE